MNASVRVVRRALVLAAWALLVAPFFASGCSGDSCPAACQNDNTLGCTSHCDCSACGTAPASCQDFFSCVASQTTCTDILFNCTEPTECSDYISKHCK